MLTIYATALRTTDVILQVAIFGLLLLILALLICVVVFAAAFVINPNLGPEALFWSW